MKNVNIRKCMLSVYGYFYLKRHNESQPDDYSNASPEYSKKQTAVTAAGSGSLNNVDKRQKPTLGALEQGRHGQYGYQVNNTLFKK